MLPTFGFLNRRETQVATLLAHGLSNKAVGAALGITPNYVGVIVTNVAGIMVDDKLDRMGRAGRRLQIALQVFLEGVPDDIRDVFGYCRHCGAICIGNRINHCPACQLTNQLH